MHDGFSDGHGHHGAIGLDRSGTSAKGTQYVAIGSPSSNSVSTGIVLGNEAGALSTLATSRSVKRIFNTPTLNSDGEVIRSYVAYVDRHGQFDVMSELARIAPRLELLWLDKFRPNFEEVDLTMYKILDRSAWLQVQAEEGGIASSEVYCACQNEAAPGWYKGATGMTRLRRQHWHLGRVPGWGIGGKLEYDPQAQTFLEIEPVLWSFYEAGDFSTALDIRIVSLLELDDTSGQFGYRRESFIRHQRVAIKLFEHMFSQLLLAEETEAQKLLRATADSRTKPTCNESVQSAVDANANQSLDKHGEKADLVITVDD